MADTPRNPPDPVAMLQRLRSEPYRYSLFAALRLIERTYRNSPRLGESRRAAHEPVRLAQPPHLSFAPSDVVTFADGEEGSKPLLEAYSFGMFGPNGALPLHLTEIAYERRRQYNDPAINDFLNFFQHRLIALFYRAWADADPVTNFDRPETDRFRLYMGALIGLGPPTSRARDGVVDFAKLSRAAQFGAQTRSGRGLESILADYFGVALQVHSFVGAWMDIPPEARSALGGNPETAGLGTSMTLGSTSWQSQHKFEVQIGPVSLANFRNFLPGAAGLADLGELIRLYTNDEWSWQLRLLLRGDEVPAVQLGGGARLGWTTWMGGRHTTAEDVVIQGELCDTAAAA
ncbi:MAG TPA: type VI secretion system baseplate subunit TssG [Steroidobacteraceae bacterium]|nr:type VI secretion system baseplate subunit TssG [Steroidobacteraceae bacterium]